MTTKQILAIGALIVLAAVAGYYVFVTGKFNPFQAAEVWPPSTAESNTLTSSPPPPSGVRIGGNCIRPGSTQQATVIKPSTQVEITPKVEVNNASERDVEVRFSSEISAENASTFAYIFFLIDRNVQSFGGPYMLYSGKAGNGWTTHTVINQFRIPSGKHTIQAYIGSYSGRTAVLGRCLTTS